MIIPPEYFTERLYGTAEKLMPESSVIYKKESLFHNIYVLKNKLGRFLSFDGESFQAGFINHADYTGNLPYLNYFLLPYMVNADIKNILILGMGSGKLANDLENLLPEIKNIDIVDIDPDIFKIAEKYFDFKKSNKINVHIQDGRVFARNSKKKYDLIIIDVCGNEGFPYRFLTFEFLEELKSILSKNGIVMSNLFASCDFDSKKNIILRAFLKTFKSVFKKTGVIRCKYSDNLFLKIFYNTDKNFADIINVIFIGCKNVNFNEAIEKADKNISIYNSINIQNMDLYAKDIYTKEIDTSNTKALSDVFEDDPLFCLENLKNYVQTWS